MSIHQYQVSYTKEYPDGSTDAGIVKFITKETATTEARWAEGRKYLGFGKPFIARDCRVSKIK